MALLEDRRKERRIQGSVVVRFAMDDAALFSLHARAFAYRAAPPPNAVESWRTRLERLSLSWVGAFDANELIGFVRACWDGGRHAFLLDTVVAPSHRRRSIGSLLVVGLIGEVKNAGCHWLHVDFELALETVLSSGRFHTDRRWPDPTQWMARADPHLCPGAGWRAQDGNDLGR